MRNIGLLVITMLFNACTFGQDQSSCNKKTPFKSLEKKIDSIVCIPDGHIIVDVYEVDINGRESKDKIFQWFKDYPRTNGDKTFYTIYLSTPGELEQFRTYSNISPIYFDLKSRSSSVILSDSILNETKYLMGNALNASPKFKKGTILIEFEVAARTFIKLYFTFSKSRNTFVLTKQELYYSSDSKGLDKGLEKTDTFSEQDGLDIEDFNYLDFIYY